MQPTTSLTTERTWLLVCDLCGNRTRIPTKNAYTSEYLYYWKREHDVRHVYLDRPGDYTPRITDPFMAIPRPCDE